MRATDQLRRLLRSFRRVRGRSDSFRRPGFEFLESRQMLSISPTFSSLGTTFYNDQQDLYIPLTSGDTGQNVAYSVTNNSNANFSAQVLTGNPTIDINFSGDGFTNQDITIQLFANITPNTASAIENLIANNAYSTASFYRVITSLTGYGNFLLAQGGVGGAGTGATLNDEFNSAVAFNSPGIIGLARLSSNDTGNSEFFITDPAASYAVSQDTTLEQNLNFQYTAFGQLTSGFSAFQQMMTTAVTTSSQGENSQPVTPITINSVTIVNDTQNAVLQIQNLTRAVGADSIMITASDGTNPAQSETLNVYQQTSTVTDPAFLGPVPATISTTEGHATTLNLTAINPSNGTLTYIVTDPNHFGASPPNVNVNVNQVTGAVTLTPAAGFSGPVSLLAGVSSAGSPTAQAQFDTQTLTMYVNAGTLSPSALPTDTIGAAYNQTITASGMAGSTTLTVSNLQNAIPGLTIPATAANTLAISGAPTATGTETFTVTAADASGNTTTADYSITVNPPVYSGATLNLAAASSSDNLAVAFTDATHFTVTVGAVSTNYTTSAVSKIIYQGEGDNSATVVDPFNTVYANMTPAALQVIGANYEVQTTGTVNNTVTGSRGDSANLTGGAGNNRFYGNPTSSMLINTDVGTAYSETANSFGTVNATSSSTSDTAYLNDAAGANTFTGHPTFATLSGPGYSYQVNAFPVVYAYQQSGNDTAYLYDAAGGSLDSHQAYSVVYGQGYYNDVSGFQVVLATMASVNDQAFLYDSSGSNVFERHPASGSTPTYSVFYGAGFYNAVYGSLEVTATAANSSDQAYLNDSTTDSRLYANPTATTLANTDTGTFFNFLVNNFGNVKTAETGANATAYMYDSPGEDRFYGQPAESVMAGIDYSNVVDGFGVVFAFSAGGGNDYAYLFDVQNNGTFYGYDGNSVMQGSNYYYNAVGFRYVFALSAGGNTAYLSDNGGNATLDAHQPYSVLYGDTFYNLASNFKTVNATGNGNRANDTAFLNDSPGNDHISAVGDTAQILYPTNIVNINAFANVLARSTLGGGNTKTLQAVDYNLAVTGNWI
jgi:cyclophilin family peptidyl-prolyl cis-trans isomerase